MKVAFKFLILFSAGFISAQNSFETGIQYGSSDLMRKSNDSHYNYENSEFGIFAGKNVGWKRNQGDRIRKFWMYTTQLYLGNYLFIAEDRSQKPFRAIVFGGLKLQKPLDNINLHAKGMIGSGYQTGYYERLPAGIYFTEKLNLGIEFKNIQKLQPFLDVGIMHVSNGNFYKLNRGIEVVYVELGILIPERKSED